MSIKIALAGNPNCGKTTLFNALTGSNQFVGNWPGVTVEKKEGRLKGHKDVAIMDLPGIYSLSPYTLEEVVARNYLINERPDAIINIVDGTNIERNLYLSTQIMELGIPVIMAVNMIDLLAKNGIELNIAKLSEKLGCEVVEISALKGTGIKEAAEKAVKLAESKKLNTIAHKFDDKVEAAISAVEDKLGLDIVEEQKRFISEFPAKYKVSFIEGDYDTKEFYDIAKGYEQCREGGERCFRCYELRLRKTCETAKAGGFDYFTTTLSISPLKNSAMLNSIGYELGKKYGVPYLLSDFKKKEGYKRSIELSHEYNLYRQNYCGCVFSKKESLEREKKKQENSLE